MRQLMEDQQIHSVTTELKEKRVQLWLAKDQGGFL
jgi:hypothetical protein